MTISTINFLHYPSNKSPKIYFHVAVYKVAV